MRAFLSKCTTEVQLFRTDRFPDNERFDAGGSDLDGNYTFATSGANWYTQSSAIVPSATYASVDPLSAFNGSPLDGTWTLNVQDRAGGPAGSFSSFSINVT
ncbi:MAG: proprotein convertase P-domain-containing protein, partial [Dolichospermum sp.]